MSSQKLSHTGDSKHSTWVKTTHWIGTISFLLLVFTGVEIIMVHPRFYWGEVGNDLTPALFELPISRNYHHGGWEKTMPFFTNAGSPVSASRTYAIFNKNGWGRSLHFLSAWFLVITGLLYLLTAILSGHIKRNLLPKTKELSFRLLIKDIADHIRMKFEFIKGPQYGLLQKLSYLIVLFFLFPIIILTGLTMSPAIAAACPFLLKIFFGAQSARTIHFFAAALLVLFLIVHILMIIRTGFKQHMRAMTFGR
jgi:thiosulfate reductase cytochrome b subunit